MSNNIAPNLRRVQQFWRKNTDFIYRSAVVAEIGFDTLLTTVPAGGKSPG
jgi:hypothetical protein